MSILSWCSRRVGGLSLTTLLILCSWVLWIEIKGKRHDGTTDNAASSLHFTQQTGRPTWRAQSVLPTVLAYYSLFIHVLVTIFPFRACWGIWDVTRNLKRAAGAKKVKKNLTVERKLSSGSISSAKTLTPSTSSAGSSDTEDIDPGFYGDDEQDLNRPYHAILIPNYKEDVEILRETLDVLASHSQARRQYDVSQQTLFSSILVREQRDNRSRRFTWPWRPANRTATSKQCVWYQTSSRSSAPLNTRCIRQISPATRPEKVAISHGLLVKPVKDTRRASETTLSSPSSMVSC